MESSKQDLRTLSRTPTMSTAAQGAISVPPPRRRWKTRVLVPAAILLAFAGVLGYAARSSLWPAIDVRVVPVVAKPGASAAGAATTVQRGLGPVLVQAPGWIEPSPYAVSVPALVEGVVKEVLVLEGDRVVAGQIVARLIDADEALRVRSAEAMIAERESEVARTRSATEQARSQVIVEAAMADEVRDEVTRKRELVAGGGISEGSFHRLEIRLSGLDARTASAQKAVLESEAAEAQAKAGVSVARAALDEAKLRLERTAVRATSAGVVLARLVEPGTRISMGSRGADGGASMSGAVVRLYDPARLQVRVDVPLADAAKVGIGTVAEVTTEALPDKTFKGVVSRIIHEANIQRNTVQVKVSIEESVATLKPEMLTRVRFYSPPSKPGDETTATSGGDGTLRLFVPVGALMDVSKEKASVWLVDQSSSRLGPIAVRKDITILPGSEESDDGYAEATGGLHAGDRLVIKPPPTLTLNARVRVIDDAAAPNLPAQGGH